MKKILTITCLLLSAFWLQAQITVNVSGNVADSNGNGVAGVNMMIDVPANTPNGFSYSNFLSTDNNGNYSDTFNVPNNASQGIVNVTMYDCDSLGIIQTHSWNPGNINLVANFDYCSNVIGNCDVSITADSTIVGLALLANPTGTAPFTYLWSTGETTALVVPNPNTATYCVTVTDANGCSASICITIPTTSDCDVSISQETVPGSTAVLLTANATGTAPFTYSWSNPQGATTETVTATQTGTYCVTMIDADGCGATNCTWVEVGGVGNDSLCWVEIIPVQNGSWLQANAGGTAPFTYLWNTGETTAAIAINATTQVYCVTIIDATGCEVSACFTIVNTNCDVTITADPNAGLTANAIGTAPFSYVWNTNETTQTIFPTSFGNYCVTMTDANGCSDSDCYFFGIVDSCEVSIQIDSTGAGLILTAITTGNGPFIYEWSNNNQIIGTSSSLSVTTSGTYCLTVIEANGCAATTCMTVVIGGPPSGGIYGNVWPSDSTGAGILITGSAKLYNFEPNGGGVSFVEEVDLENTPIFGGASYQFEDVAPGEYFVRVELSPNSPLAMEYVPTYHYSALLWDEAEIIQVPNNVNLSFDVFLIPDENLTGPGDGNINGQVTDGDGFTDKKDETESGGDPIPGVSVLLLNQDELPVSVFYTDGNGQYSFDNLPWGTYKVVIEIPGLEQAWYWVTLGPDNPTATGLDFEVTSEGVSTGLAEAIVQNEIKVFPNPVNDVLQINLNVTESIDTQVSISTLTGKVVHGQSTQLHTGNQTIEIDLNYLPSGIYFLNIANGKEVISKRIVKQ